MSCTRNFAFAIAATAAVVDAVQYQDAMGARAMANPIRKVVNMLVVMQKKVEAEGEKEKEMYAKYMCYCKTSGADLKASIASSDAKIPEVASDIKEGEAKKAQFHEDLVSDKGDRKSAEEAIAEATAIREKEAAAFAAKKASYGSDILAMEKAIAALEKGMAGAFLQTRGAQTLRNLVGSTEDLIDADRQEILAFLSGGQGSNYAPQSGEIVGILKQLMETMAGGLAQETANENKAISSYEELITAKKKEISALTAAIEAKTKKI